MLVSTLINKDVLCCCLRSLHLVFLSEINISLPLLMNLTSLFWMSSSMLECVAVHAYQTLE